MSGNPAVLISDELINVIEERSLCKVYFRDLTGTEYPWEVDLHSFQDIRGKFYRIEQGLRNANPEQEITCILAGRGAFWVTRPGVEDFFEGLKKPLKKLKIEGAMPVWKMTSAEVFGSHLSNMRQMILAAAHDMVLLEYLRESLGNQHDFIHREFEHCELTVRALLDNIKDQGPNLNFATHQEIIMVERCRITIELLERGVRTEQELGYTREDLERVMEILDKSCRKDYPAYNKRIASVFNQVKHCLQDGEGAQLTRSSRWEMTYALCGRPPVGFRNQAEIVSVEREGMKALVCSRVEELGSSEITSKAMEISQQVDQVLNRSPEKAMPKIKEEEPILAAAAGNEPKKSSQVNRMAYTSRRR